MKFHCFTPCPTEFDPQKTWVPSVCPVAGLFALGFLHCCVFALLSLGGCVCVCVCVCVRACVRACVCADALSPKTAIPAKKSISSAELIWSGSGIVYQGVGGILDKTHPPNFGPIHPTFDPPRPPQPLLYICGEHFL